MDFIYDSSGKPYAMVSGDRSVSAVYYYVLNHQGDVIRIVTGGGATVAEYVYNAWGKIISTGGWMANQNPIRYRDYFQDNETGFYYLQSRYYDPSIGRFINADDTSNLAANGDFISLNLFTYCGNNPVMRTDNEGNVWHLIIGAAIGVGTQFLSDYLSGSTSSFSDYAIAAVGGALAASGIGKVGSIIANATLGGVSYLANCKNQGKEANGADFLIAVGIGGLSGAVGGSGANGAKLKGVYKTSKAMLKTVVSPKKVAMYTAKISFVKKTIIESTARTIVAGLFSNFSNGYRKKITQSTV